LLYDASVRPTAEEALQLPWMISYEAMRRISLTPSSPTRMDLVQASISNFSKYSTLKKLALMVVAHKSTSEELGYLRKMFKRFDSSNDGAVTLDEFKKALEDYEYTDEEIEAIFKGMVSLHLMMMLCILAGASN
jgi:Ca2+-binding EF-hand superfamily protein